MKKKAEEVSTMSSVIMNGVMYELTNEPSHGVIRAVRKVQKDISINLIKKHRDKFAPDTKVEDALQAIFDENPEEISEYTDASEEFEILGLLSLATNKFWTSDAIAVISEKELQAAIVKCKEVLGGSVASFL